MSDSTIEVGLYTRRIMDKVNCPGCGELQEVIEYGLYGKIAQHRITRGCVGSPLVRTATGAIKRIAVVYVCPASLAIIELV